MKKKKLTWANYKTLLGRVSHITHDWLTPKEFLPYINTLLGEIDLDPCSTYDANVQFLKAKKIYTLKEDGLNIEDPWTGKTYLFPPTFGRNWPGKISKPEPMYASANLFCVSSRPNLLPEISKLPSKSQSIFTPVLASQAHRP